MRRSLFITAVSTCSILLSFTMPLAQTPTLLADLGESATIWYITAVGGNVFFSGGDEDTGHELWTSDGTPGGTRRVMDIWPGVNSGDPMHLADLGGICIFGATPGNTVSRELWRSDGTLSGTWLVKDINPSAGSNPGKMTPWNGVVYFVALDDPAGLEIHRSDGTEEGTYLLKDMYPGTSAGADYFTEAGGIFYFVSTDPDHGTELFKTDGTEAGTVIVKDINPSGNSSPHDLADFDGMLYFAADDGGSARTELWRSDGTDAGTVRVANIHPTLSSSPTELCAFDGVLYFQADDGTHGDELWKTDGTAAGTEMVKDFNAYGDGNPEMFTVVGNTLFFRASDYMFNVELWKTDGTEAGTVRIKDIRPGTSGSYPSEMVDYNGTLYFLADDGANGNELWKSDGTEAGTVMVHDFVTGSVSSLSGSEFEVAGGKLFFSVTNRDESENIVKQLWMLEESSIGAPENFTVDYSDVGNQLTWSNSAAKAFTHYCIYRGADPEFVPAPENMVHTTLASEWFDDEGDFGHFYKLTAADDVGGESEPVAPESVTGVAAPQKPGRLLLHPNTPNPFNPATEVEYSVPGPGRLEIVIYDPAGRKVATLRAREVLQNGKVTWAGVDDSDRRVPSGVYFCVARFGDRTAIRKIAMIK